MTGEEFAALIRELTLSWASGDGVRVASHFTEDAIYDDFMYGPHTSTPTLLHLDRSAVMQ